MKKSVLHVSVTEEAYQRLREDLLAGRFPAGGRLKIGELCRTLSLNLSAVREALSRLGSEGLVSFEPQRGYRAVPLSSDELHDLTSVRIEIEGSCLRRSIAAGDLTWEGNILAAFHLLCHTPKPTTPNRQPVDPWFVAHAAFHQALVDACDSPWMLRLRALLFVQTERYRRLSVQLSIERDVDAEHRALMQACLARDADRAMALMSEHLRTTTRFLACVVEANAAADLLAPAKRVAAGR